jgi:alpha-glucosidase
MTFSIAKVFKPYLIQLERLTGALKYSWQRDRWEEPFSQAHTRQPVDVIQTLVAAEAIPQGAIFNFQSIQLKIEFQTASTARLEWSLMTEEPLYHSIEQQDAAVYLEEQEETVAVKLRSHHLNLPDHDGSPNWEVASDDLRILVYPSGCVTFFDPEGNLLRHEYPPQSLEVPAIEVGKSAVPPGWVHTSKLHDAEHIYGLGERATHLNLRGPNRYRMWNTDAQGKYDPGDDPLYICIPTYISLHHGRCYLVFYENSCDGMFQFHESANVTFEGGPLCYYFSIGKPSALIDSYTQLTGRPMLPPRWAFGYHHCRWGYERQSELTSAVENMEKHNIPVKAFHLDIDCLDHFEPFTVSPDRFPDIQKIAQQLAEKDIQIITILHACITANPKSSLFQEGVKQGYFCSREDGSPLVGPLWAGNTAYVDFTNPTAREWWSQQYKTLLDLGFNGFWHDMNEPAFLTVWGDPSLPPYATQHDFDGEGGNHLMAHNLYGVLQAQAAYEYLRKVQPEKRPFILSRSGWAGLQKYAWTWTGDLSTSWASLRQTIPTVLNLGLSGIPYSGPDIGGFIGNPTPELYLRWFQLGCFMPFCRTHGSKKTKPRVPWVYGDRTLEIARQFIELRYALMPYFYTLAWESHQTGAPLVRPLFWHAPEMEQLWDIEDSFLLGEALLICPIVEESILERQVTLPPGDWYDFWNDQITNGGQTIVVKTSLEHIPIFAQAGQIVPMVQADKLTLHLYFDDRGVCGGSLYSDDGDGYTLGRVDYFDCAPKEGKWHLKFHCAGDPDFSYEQVEIVLHGLELELVWAGDRLLESDTAASKFTIQSLQMVSFTGRLTIGSSMG